jgi:BrnA antitoxin of type II toxin-antitoxin system
MVLIGAAAVAFLAAAPRSYKKGYIQGLKGQGRGYQTRINRILRVAMESQGPRAADR